MSQIEEILAYANQLARSGSGYQTKQQKKQESLDALLIQIQLLLDLAEKKADELQVKPQIAEVEEQEQTLTQHAEKFGLPVVFEELLIDQVSYPRRRN